MKSGLKVAPYVVRIGYDTLIVKVVKVCFDIEAGCWQQVMPSKKDRKGDAHN